MSLSEAEEQERQDYIFQHNYNRVEQATKRLGKKGSTFPWNVVFEKDKGLKSTYTTPDQEATMEFAVSISKFALPSEPYNIDKWLQFLRSIASVEHSAEFDKVQNILKKIRKGNLELNIDGMNFTAEKAYETFANRIIFASDIDAMAYVNDLNSKGPVYHMMLSMHDDYCIGTCSLTFVSFNLTNLLGVTLTWLQKAVKA